MNKRYYVIILVVSFMLIFLVTAFAGVSNQPLMASNGATEGVYDSLIYQGVPIQAPIQQATPVPSHLSNPSEKVVVTATASATAKIYYGPSTSYVLRGTFTSSRVVNVIEKEGNYYLIEYSVSGGSVRGYILGTSLTGILGSVSTASNNIHKFGLNVYGATATVYGGPSKTSYVAIGSISNREIVTVLKASGSSWYHIEYDTANGNKRGYIQAASTRIPGLTYAYNMPIRMGTRTADYRSGHNGIDIETSVGTSVYAITTGLAKYRTAYEVINGKNVMVSYGNFIEITFNGNKAYYAHLSSFANGFTAKTFSNPNPVRGASSKTKYIEHGTVIVTNNMLLGSSGNTGNVTGSHLHFEVRDGGTTIVDPFKYVLFAKMPL